MKRISKWEAKRRFAASEPVIFCPVKMRPGGPWSMGCTIFGRDYDFDWDKAYRNWEHANGLCYETGYYAAYYIED